MIQVVMKPVPGEGVVHRETLYTALFNGADIGMKVRALRASHAEEKVMELLRHSIDKVGGRLLVDYDLEKWKGRRNGSDTGAHEELREAAEPAEVAAPDEAWAREVRSLLTELDRRLFASRLLERPSLGIKGEWLWEMRDRMCAVLAQLNVWHQEELKKRRKKKCLR